MEETSEELPTRTCGLKNRQTCGLSEPCSDLMMGFSELKLRVPSQISYRLFPPTVSLQVSVLLNTVEPLPTTAISEDRKKSGR